MTEMIVHGSFRGDRDEKDVGGGMRIKRGISSEPEPEHTLMSHAQFLHWPAVKSM